MSLRGEDWNAAVAAMSDPALLAELEAEAPPAEMLVEVLPRVLPAGYSLIQRSGDGGAYRRGLMTVIATIARHDGKWWLHASCAMPHRLPSWADLREVKDIFVGRDRTALQVLPRAERHVNVHNYCLHLWCCLDGDVTPDFTRGRRTI